MANTNVVEKDLAARSGSGDGWNAWPFIWMDPLVSMRRPLAVTVAAPSRVRLAPEKPSYANCRPPLPPVAAAQRSAAARRSRSRVKQWKGSRSMVFASLRRGAASLFACRFDCLNSISEFLNSKSIWRGFLSLFAGRKFWEPTD
ncbi:Os07g0575733 [Oryza sativa Japonica Group]|uniref:Os07g0575733 protein n=1 Tax=Oryza sativa subsp. japonica TaxID=39947 RepID=A0A0P0X7W7_ORYSJ|nr:hypothetical protein EE612_040242 [Oryza sativa]BAT02288.1 Os07g0575733 [Oryza sativa Japonica Group]